MAQSEAFAKITSRKQVEYYTKDNRHECQVGVGAYYGKDGTIEQSQHMLSGRWYDPHGITSKNLNGQTINEQDFRAILDGRDPELIDPKTGDLQRMVRNSGAENRVMGIDLTLSPPKIVSLMWASSDEAKKHLIEKIQHDAALAAVKFADENLVITRRGAGGVREEKAHGIYALFDHKTARPAEGLVAPQLHTHCIFSGMVRAEDGKMLALQEKKMMNWRSAFENVYHAELANGLRKLGYEIEVEKGKTAFRIKGMEQFQEACEELSPRKKQILQNVREQHGDRDIADLSRAEYQAAVTTNRAGKLELERKLLDWTWENAINKVGVTTNDVRSAMQEIEARAVGKEHANLVMDEKQLAEFREQIAAELHERDSTFTEGVLYGRVAFHLQGKASSEEIHHVFSSVKGGLVPIGLDKHGEHLFASETQIALEKRMVEQAKTPTPQHVMDREYVEKLIASVQTPELKAAGKAMTDPQAEAVREMLCGNGAARLVGISEGAAGSGKSYSANLIRQAYEEHGYTVHGIALGWKQAQVLGAEAKLEHSRAIAGFLKSVEQGKLKLDSKSVILIDEGGLVGTKEMARIVGAAEAAGAKIVLTGDTRQLNPIGGAAMRTLVNELGSTRIGDTAEQIRRQKVAWQAQAGLDIATATAKNPTAEKAVQAYRDGGHFTLSKDRDESMTALVAAVRAHREAHPEQSQIVIANTRSDVRKLNEQLREMKREIGEITGPNVEITCGDGDETRYTAKFAVGESIQLRKNDKDQRTYNRTLGTITAVDDSGEVPSFKVRLEDNREITISATADNPYYDGKTGAFAFEPAHCQTVFSAQGATVDKAFVFDAANLDRRLAYVAMTRHRLDVDVFLDRESEHERIVTPDDWRHPNALTEDEIFSDVSARWSRSQDKLTTYDLLKNSAYDLSKADEQKEAERISLLDENARIIERAQLTHEANRAYADFEAREAARRQRELELNPEAANDLHFNPYPEFTYEQLRTARRAAVHQPDHRETERSAAPDAGAGLRELSGLELVQHVQRLDDIERLEVLLQADAHHRVGQESRPDHELRREGVGPAGVGSEGAGLTETRDLDFSGVTIYEPPQARPDLRARLDSAPVIFAASEASAETIATQELAANQPATVIVVEDVDDIALRYPAVRDAIQSADRPIYLAGDINRSTADRIMQIAAEHPTSADKAENSYRDLVRERDHDREHTI